MALERRQQVTIVTTAAPTTSDRLADTAATRFLPSATAGGAAAGTDDSNSSVLDIWQYTILVVVVLGAVAFFSTICIFRRQRRRTRARRTARLAAVEDGLGRETEFAARGDFDDAVSMSEMQSTHSRVLPPPAYQERPRSSGLSSTVTTTTEVGSDSRPSTGNRRPSLSNRLSRFPSAIGSFLNKRVQPNLGGTNVSTDEMQTQSAEAQLAAARRQQQRQPTRRSSSTSSIFAFSPRRASSGGETGPVPESPTTRSRRLHSEPPSAETLEQVRHIRRALSDAGLLFAPPRSLSDHRLSTGSAAAAAGGNRPAMLATTHEGLRNRFDEEEEAEREIAREERRARRRRRRERERQRMEDEAGLPTYSREVAEGEAVLERAEGWKSADDDDGGDDDDEHDECSRIEDGGRTNGEQRARPPDTVAVGEGQGIPIPVLPPDPAAVSPHGH